MGHSAPEKLGSAPKHRDGWQMLNRYDDEGRCLCSSWFCRFRRGDLLSPTKYVTSISGFVLLIYEFLFRSGEPEFILVVSAFALLSSTLFTYDKDVRVRDPRPGVPLPPGRARVPRAKERDDLTRAWEEADGPTLMDQWIETDDVIKRLEIEDEMDYRLELKERPPEPEPVFINYKRLTDEKWRALRYKAQAKRRALRHRAKDSYT